MDKGRDINWTSNSVNVGACKSTAAPLLTINSSSPPDPIPDNNGQESFGAAGLSRLHDEANRETPERDMVEFQEQFLINPETTELVLANLDIGRLKACRLVCKTWTQEVSRMLKTRSIVYLSSLKDYHAFKGTCEAAAELNSPLPFNRVSVANIRAPALPVLVDELQQRYSLTICEMTTVRSARSGLLFVNGISRNPKKAKRARTALLLALQKCGSALTRLGLLVASSNMSLARGLGFPYLEILVLEEPENMGGGGGGVESFEGFPRDIFRFAPNLTHLKVIGSSLPKRIVESWEGLERLKCLILLYGGTPEDILIPMSGFRQSWALQGFYFAAVAPSSALTDAAISGLFFQFVAKVAASIKKLEYFAPGKLVGTFPSCPQLTHLYLRHTHQLDELSFDNLVALKALLQLETLWNEPIDELTSSIQPYKQLQRLYRLALPNKYAGPDNGRLCFKRYALAFPNVSVWDVSLVHLRELSALASQYEIRVQGLTVRYKVCDQTEECLGTIKLIPGLQVLQLGNMFDQKYRGLRLGSIQLSQLRDLKILNFYYTTYGDIAPGIEDMKQVGRVGIFGTARTHCKGLQDVLLKLPQAVCFARNRHISERMV